MRDYASATVSGYSTDDGVNDVVIMALYGPRGGTRTTEVLSVEQAESLANELLLAVARIKEVSRAAVA